jgi:phosphatidate cytidylyltransferase
VAACIVAPAAIYGDLLESLFKRSLHIKDSGNILPGHGGILDRFDAVLFTVPFFYLWYLIFNDL